MADDIDSTIDKEIARGDLTTVAEEKPDKREPVYQMRGGSKIPVSKAHGSLWKSRRDQALSRRNSRDLSKAWDEALRYYRNDQTAHRTNTDDPDYPGNEGPAMKMTRGFSETENVVFANTSALVPMLYAKNPTAEFTANDPDDDRLAVVLESLIAQMMGKKASPGVNLKPKVRKAVVMCTLTNAAYIESGWTFRTQSTDQALEDLAKLSVQLEKAKSPQDVRDIEGRIEALEKTVDILRPAGAFCKFRRPHDILFDPDGIEDDHNDAKWLMIGDYVSTEWLNATFSKRKGQSTVSVYKPSHVISKMNAGGNGENTAEMEINNYSIFNADDDKKANGHQDYGYGDEGSYRKAQRTRVQYVWDRTTRRVFLYNDSDWSWPIWVWDDPYNLQGFFPVRKLQFYTDPEEPMGKGEVTYYLDQQDAINQINSEFKQARQWARRNLFFDKNKVSKDEVERMLKGDEDVAVGVDVPEGMNLKDFVQSIVPPSMQFIQLFDKTPIFEAIDRVSSVQPVMRGAEYKTNTTNQAISQYNSTQQTRTDEKIDAVEDFIGGIAWDLAQMALQFMNETDVASILGKRHAVGWRIMDATEISANVQMTVVGGSTQKKTSESKKQQALQMGQVLGQFVNAAPVPVLMTMIQTMRGAFNDVIPDEQWKTIMDAVQQQGQQPPAGSGTGGGGAGGGGGNAEPTSGGGAVTPQQGGDPIAAIEEIIDALPAEAKQALGAAMAQGVPVRVAMEKIMEAMQQQQPQV